MSSETQLGPFTVERELGRGGMGVVYAAQREGRPVALKVALEDITARDKKHFLAEAELLGRVSHPGVVEILDSGTLPDGRFYLAMPLLPGETLAARLKRGPLDPELALRLFAQLAGAVIALHDAGIVHRDIKTENVMLDEDEERLVLLDFGIAREADSAASTTTRLNRVRGTPGSMAPERFFGMRASAASDVYELAVVLYAMVTAQIPWSSATDPSARLTPRDPAELGVPLPEGLGKVLVETLTGRPDRRPSARELAVRVRATEGARLVTREDAKELRVTAALPAQRDAPPLGAALSEPGSRPPLSPSPFSLPLSPPVGSPPAGTPVHQARSIPPPTEGKPRRPIPPAVWATGAVLVTVLAVGGAFRVRARRGHAPAASTAVVESALAAPLPVAPAPPSASSASVPAPAPSVAVTAVPVATSKPTTAPQPSGTSLVALPAPPPPALLPVPSGTPATAPPVSVTAAPSAAPVASGSPQTPTDACQQLVTLYCAPAMRARGQQGNIDCLSAQAYVRRDETVVESYCRGILPDAQRLAREQATAAPPAPGSAPACRRIREAYCGAAKLDYVWATACQNAQADVAAAEGPTARAGDLRAKESMCQLQLASALRTVREHFEKKGVTPP